VIRPLPPVSPPVFSGAGGPFLARGTANHRGRFPELSVAGGFSAGVKFLFQAVGLGFIGATGLPTID
jgi:hypothetical protein